jgi:hypothetical protein
LAQLSEAKLTMNLELASIIIRGSIPNWYWIPIFVAVLGMSITAPYWRLFAQWLRGIRVRDWTPVSAVIDVVTVVEQTEQGRYGKRTIGYIATLTYVYRNPEPQTGDYIRLFDEETDARDWAASYRGETVMVHVDPRDPSHSVLRKEEL